MRCLVLVCTWHDLALSWNCSLLVLAFLKVDVCYYLGSSCLDEMIVADLELGADGIVL